MKSPLLVLAFSLTVALPSYAQRDQAPVDAPRLQRRPGTPPLARMGPWNRDLQLLCSSDGLTFSGAKTFTERAGVPCLTQDAKGRLIAVFQWFPMDRREDFDRIAVKFSDDNGATWTEPQRVEFRDLPPEYERQFDPTIVALEDGRYRLFFTSHPGRDPGRVNTAIYSAISSDAIHFTFEPGQRFGAAEENVVDCSVARLGDTWHLFAPLPRQDGGAYHAASKDGLSFERQADVSAPVRGTWIGNVINVDGGLKFYGSGRGGVWSATSHDGSEWQVQESAGARGGDPAVWRLKGGEYMMVVTGDMRADAPMDPPWQRTAVHVEPPHLGDGQQPRIGDLAPTSGNSVAMTVADGFLYIVRDGMVYQFGARDLNFIRQAPLPEPRRGQRPPVRLREGDEPARPPRQ